MRWALNQPPGKKVALAKYFFLCIRKLQSSLWKPCNSTRSIFLRICALLTGHYTNVEIGDISKWRLYETETFTKIMQTWEETGKSKRRKRTKVICSLIYMITHIIMVKHTQGKYPCMYSSWADMIWQKCKMLVLAVQVAHRKESKVLKGIYVFHFAFIELCTIQWLYSPGL